MDRPLIFEALAGVALADVLVDCLAQIRKIKECFDGHPGPGFAAVCGYGVIPFDHFLRHGRWNNDFSISTDEFMALNILGCKVGLGE